MLIRSAIPVRELLMNCIRNITRPRDHCYVHGAANGAATDRDDGLDGDAGGYAAAAPDICADAYADAHAC